jgi:hypothetical protein
MPTDNRLFFNGVNLATGQASEPEAPKEFFTAIKAERAEQRESPAEVEKNQFHLLLDQELSDSHLGLVYGYDPLQIEDAGWCLLYPPSTSPEVLQALQPLAAHRNARPAMQVDPALPAYEFRKSHGQLGGDVDPDKMPYYMLIIGPPSGLSYEFQHDLDAMHAVGRIDLPTPEAYEAYAKKVVEHELGQAPPRQRRMAIFSPESDAATQLSAECLAAQMRPVLEKHVTRLPDRSKVSYQVEHITGEEANRQALEGLLQSPAALLFTVSHGAWYFDPEKPLAEQAEIQKTYTGAIVCEEWFQPGASPGSRPAGWWPNRCALKLPKPSWEERLLSGCHIPADLDVRGLIVFTFACFGAGAPHTERFARYFNRLPQQIALQDFSAYLPQRLLTQGALAFFGHVERAWSYSFAWSGFPSDTSHFESAFRQIMDGIPVGHALESFNKRYLDMNNQLTSAQGLFFDLEHQKKPVGPQIIQAWMARQDARSWILFGDPAVRLYPERLT